MVDIIIVNWNSGDQLRKCIESVRESVHSIDYRIVVVDNNSTDGSLNNISLASADLLLRSETNMGFARACNVGVAQTDSEFILFLNPDTVMMTETIESSVSTLELNPSIGVVGVKQVNANHEIVPSCSRFLRLHNLIFDVTGLSRLLPRVFKPATIMSDWNHQDSMIVDQIMGSYWLMRRSAFLLSGGFDERFFVYYEDMDLAKRIHDLGLSSYYLSEVRIIHTGCGTSNRVKDLRLFYSLSSRIKYTRKNNRRLESYMILLVTLFPEPFARVAYSLISNRNLGDAVNIVRGYKLFLKWLISGE